MRIRLNVFSTIIKICSFFRTGVHFFIGLLSTIDLKLHDCKLPPSVLLICQISKNCRLISYNADANLIGGVLASSPIHWAARNGLVAMCAVLVKVCSKNYASWQMSIHVFVGRSCLQCARHSGIHANPFGDTGKSCTVGRLLFAQIWICQGY